MSRQREKIRKAAEAKGYSLVSADWQPIGQQVEMAGREGGWTVEAEPDELAVGYSADDVVDWINEFWPSVRIDGETP